MDRLTLKKNIEITTTEYFHKDMCLHLCLMQLWLCAGQLVLELI